MRFCGEIWTCGPSRPRPANGSQCISAKSPTATTSGRGFACGLRTAPPSARRPAWLRPRSATLSRPLTGTYLVLVGSFDSGFDGTGTYRLTMTKTPGPITVSPDDQGGPLTNGGIHTGETLQGDLDVWTFTANVGERIAVHIGEITDTDDFRPWIRVWAPNGATLGSAFGLAAAEIGDIVAPVTGTYLVLVGSFDSGFDGTGTYRLNMAKTPGPITVSTGDQGGPLTNGGLHTGEILQGDLDVWTFTATAGERIALHIGEITDTDDFRPWIRALGSERRHPRRGVRPGCGRDRRHCRTRSRAPIWCLSAASTAASMVPALIG